MKAITLRNIPPRVARLIERRATRDRSSLNKTVIRMLAEASQPAVPEPAERAPRGPRRDLAKLAGSWSAEEADEFDACVAEMRRVDAAMWK